MIPPGFQRIAAAGRRSKTIFFENAAVRMVMSLWRRGMTMRVFLSDRPRIVRIHAPTADPRK
jgi:hypothetical protein